VLALPCIHAYPLQSALANPTPSRYPGPRCYYFTYQPHTLLTITHLYSHTSSILLFIFFPVSRGYLALLTLATLPSMSLLLCPAM